MTAWTDDMRHRALSWLGHHRLPLILALLAPIPVLHSLGVGLVGDDYFHHMMIKGSDPLFTNSPYWGLFTFFPGGESNGPLIEQGVIPWWGNPAVKASFLRPLSAASHVFDYAAFGNVYPLHHLHSLLWFSLCIGLVALLYRRVMPTPMVAGLAALLFAVEEARGTPVGWLANRNALITLAFGLAALMLHIHWRRTRRWVFMPVALGLAVAGLAAGENTLGVFAYVAGWQLFMDGPGWKARLAGVLPWLGLGGAYTVLYSVLGYGASGSGLYIDPGSEPLRFLLGVAERWPLLMGAQWLQAPIDVWMFLDRTPQIAVVGFCGIAVCALLALAWGLLKDCAQARFWAAGMALSLVPACGAFPMDRLIVFSGVGAFAVMSLLAARTLEGLGARVGSGGPRLVRWAVIGLLVLHGPVALAVLPARVAIMKAGNNLFAAGANAGPRGPEVSGQTFVFVTGSELPVAYTQVMRAVDGIVPPLRVAQLASLLSNNTITRVDDNTLRIEPQGGFLGPTMDRVTRHPASRFQVGDVIVRPDFEARVDALTPDGRPARASFRFRNGLDDPALVWLAFVDGEPVSFELPAVGETVSLKKGLPGM